jgi:hypothetical protein
MSFVTSETSVLFLRIPVQCFFFEVFILSLWEGFPRIRHFLGGRQTTTIAGFEASYTVRVSKIHKAGFSLRSVVSTSEACICRLPDVWPVCSKDAYGICHTTRRTRWIPFTESSVLVLVLRIFWSTLCHVALPRCSLERPCAF